MSYTKTDNWICPACGEENNSKFCLTCGAKMPEQTLEVQNEEVSVKEETLAPEVKQEIFENQNDAAPVAEEKMQEEAKPEETKPAELTWTCPACEEVNITRFCITCGTKAPEEFLNIKYATLIEKVEAEVTSASVEEKQQTQSASVEEKTEDQSTSVENIQANDQAASVAQEKTAPQEIQAEKAVNSIVCPVCGWVAPASSGVPKFCMECGSKLA